MELEVLLSRQGFEVPDEVRILQAENCHFRDLTFARLAEVEYWKKMYTNERNSNLANLEALRRQNELSIQDEAARIKKQLEDAIAALKREKEQLIAAFEQQLRKLKSEYEDRFRNYVPPAQAEELLRELDAIKKERDALIIEHELKIKDLKANIKRAVTEELVKKYQEHARELNRIEELFEKLRVRYENDIAKFNNQDREKLENIIKIIKKRDQQHQEEMQKLLDKMNLSKSEQIAFLTSESKQQVTSLKDENEKLRFQLVTLSKQVEGLKDHIKEVDDERHDMYDFVKRMINDGVVDKEKARIIQVEFDLKHSGSPHSKAKFYDNFGQDGIEKLIGNSEKHSNLLGNKQVEPNLPASPTFNPNYYFANPLDKPASFNFNSENQPKPSIPPTSIQHNTQPSTASNLQLGPTQSNAKELLKNFSSFENIVHSK